MKNVWKPIYKVFDNEYANYLIASVSAKFGCGYERYPKPVGRIYVNSKNGAIVPQGYGADSGIYLVINPYTTDVDFTSDRRNDPRPDWVYGHNSVVCIDVDENTGDVLRVYLPDGHKPERLSLPYTPIDKSVFGASDVPVGKYFSSQKDLRYMNYLNIVEEDQYNEVTCTVSMSNLEERVKQLENTVRKLVELLVEK